MAAVQLLSPEIKAINNRGRSFGVRGHCARANERTRSRTSNRRLTAVAPANFNLIADEVRRRMDTYGPNAIREQKRRAWWRMLLDQFTEFIAAIN